MQFDNLITVPILPTYSALPITELVDAHSSLVLTDPVEVHQTECYSSVTHHAILKRVFSKYILNTREGTRPNYFSLLPSEFRRM